VVDFEGAIPVIEKEPVKASESERLRGFLSKRVVKRSFIAHIRHATIGIRSRQNCHPFLDTDRSGRWWTLAHNGSLFERTGADELFARQAGSTDSERILLYLVERMNEAIDVLGRPLSADERFEVIEGLVRELAPGNKLNLIISDGKRMYVHCNEEGTLHFRQFNHGKLIATEPLLGGRWREVPTTRLIALRDGRIERIGEPYGQTYVYDPKQIETLYLRRAAS
jgi:glutamine amidotransferase